MDNLVVLNKIVIYFWNYKFTWSRSCLQQLNWKVNKSIWKIYKLRINSLFKNCELLLFACNLIFQIIFSSFTSALTSLDKNVLICLFYYRLLLLLLHQTSWAWNLLRWEPSAATQPATLSLVIPVRRPPVCDRSSWICNSYI